jgi:hypothetical protein
MKMAEESDAPSITPAEAAGPDTGDSLLTEPPKAVDAEAVDAEKTSDAPDTTDAEEESSDEGGEDTGEYQDFTAPEGMELDTTLLEQAVPLFKEAGLSQEMAQKFIDLQASTVQQMNEANVEAYTNQMKEWQNQSMNDKEFGGDKFEESVATARLAIEKLGTPELTKLMDDVGVGNHPEMIRFMHKVGSRLKEDVPGQTGAKSAAAKDRVSTMYPEG